MPEYHSLVLLSIGKLVSDGKFFKIGMNLCFHPRGLLEDINHTSCMRVNHSSHNTDFQSAHSVHVANAGIRLLLNQVLDCSRTVATRSREERCLAGLVGDIQIPPLEIKYPTLPFAESF